MWRLWEGLEGTKYITNKQVGGGYSLTNNEDFKVNLKENTQKREVKAWMGSKGGGGGC
jgi:hypothetical protein